LQPADLHITKISFITGARASGAEAISTIIDGGNHDRVFDIAPRLAYPFNTTFNRLAIRNGTASSGFRGRDSSFRLELFVPQ